MKPPKEEPGRKRVVASEDLEAAIEDFAAAMIDEDRLERPAPEPAERARRVALGNLHRLVASDVNVVAPFTEEDGIDRIEREREIAKAALAQLKVDRLMELARRHGLRHSGTRVELLDRLVGYFGDSEQEIAELVLRYTEPGARTRRHATRLLPLSDSLAIPEWSARLTPYAGQYLRTNVAEWFVFGAEHASETDFAIEGLLRRYEVEAAALLPDAGEKYGLRTHKRDDELVLRVHQGQPLLRVQARGESETRAATRAFTFATGVDRGDTMTPRGEYDHVEFGGLAPASVWFLALARTLARHSNDLLQSVVSVTFETDGPSAQEMSGLPRIESSRFRGYHVLDTPQICRYVTQGQVLSAISFETAYSAPDGLNYVLHGRIALDRDGILVATNFGNAGPDIAGSVHRALEDAVAEARVSWPLTSLETNRLLNGVRERATSEQQPEQASLFAPVGTRGRVEVSAVR